MVGIGEVMTLKMGRETNFRELYGKRSITAKLRQIYKEALGIDGNIEYALASDGEAVHEMSAPITLFKTRVNTLFVRIIGMRKINFLVEGLELEKKLIIK
jgi:hypothetical protein